METNYSIIHLSPAACPLPACFPELCNLRDLPSCLPLHPQPRTQPQPAAGPGTKQKWASPTNQS